MRKILDFFNEIFNTKLKLGKDLDLPFVLGDLVLKLIIPLLFSFAAYKLILLAMRRIFRSSKLKEEIAAKILRWTKIILRIILVLLFILFTFWLFGSNLSKYMISLFMALNTPFIVSGKTSISLVTIFLAIPIFYLAGWVGKKTNRLINKSTVFTKNIDENKKFSVAAIVRYSSMVLVFVVGLSIIGVDISTLTVLFGVLGIGLGFGLQATVSNLFSGLVLIFSRPVRENDLILVDGYEAKVTQIKILSTTLTTITNEIIIIPNSMLVNNPIYNYTYNDKEIIIQNEVEVAYASDLDKVTQVLIEVALRNQFAHPKKEPKVRITEFGQSGIKCLLLTWLKDLNNKYEARSWTNIEIWRSFKENGIEIPFTQVDLLIKNKSLNNDLLSVNKKPGAGKPIV